MHAWTFIHHFVHSNISKRPAHVCPIFKTPTMSNCYWRKRGGAPPHANQYTFQNSPNYKLRHPFENQNIHICQRNPSSHSAIEYRLIFFSGITDICHWYQPLFGGYLHTPIVGAMPVKFIPLWRKPLEASPNLSLCPDKPFTTPEHIVVLRGCFGAPWISKKTWAWYMLFEGWPLGSKCAWAEDE